MQCELEITFLNGYTSRARHSKRAPCRCQSGRGREGHFNIRKLFFTTSPYAAAVHGLLVNTLPCAPAAYTKQLFHTHTHTLTDTDTDTDTHTHTHTHTH